MEHVQVCTGCGKPNPVYEFYCLTCGQILPRGLRARATNLLNDVMAPKPATGCFGTALLNEKMGLALWVEHMTEPVVVWFRDECLIGRELGAIDPVVDLTPFNAIKAGVSRHHAKLIRNGALIYVTDQNSRNGTYLNGQKLLPQHRRILRNQDTLQLGLLKLRVSFIQKQAS